MLEAIRKRSAGIVVKSLLGLLILSFAMWGIADVFSPGGADRTLATVGDVEIQNDQVRREYQREMERISTALGVRLDDEQARMFGIGRAAVQRVVERALFDLGAGDIGILVNDNLVRRDIRGYSGFMNDNGQFEQARFQQLLQSNRLSEAAYVDLTRRDIARAQYLSMVGSSAMAPKRLARSLYVYRNEKRIAETVTFSYAGVGAVGEPTEDQLIRFHADNARDYTAPEYRSLTYVSLTAQEIAREIAVSDDAIAAAYEERSGDYSEPEKRTFQHIRFKTEAPARAAYDRLKGGDDFFRVAQELAGMDAKATELGDMKISELMPGLEEPAFALQVDEFTEPVKSVLGWHILRLKGIVAARVRPLSEVAPELRKQIAAEQAVDSLYELANRVEDELGGGASLEDAARALDLTPKTLIDIDANGITRPGTVANGLPGGIFLEVAFATPDGQESALTEAGDDGYFIVRVDNVTASAVRPLDSVRAGVIDAWKAGQRRDMAQNKGRSMIADIKAGGDFVKLAAEQGLSVTTTEPVGRDGGQSLPADLVTELFAANPGNAVAAPATDGYMVARLKETISPDPLADADQVNALGEQLNMSIRVDLMNQLANALRKRFPVSINTEAVDAQMFNMEYSGNNSNISHVGHNH